MRGARRLEAPHRRAGATSVATARTCGSVSLASTCAAVARSRSASPARTSARSGAERGAAGAHGTISTSTGFVAMSNGFSDRPATVTTSPVIDGVPGGTLIAAVARPLPSSVPRKPANEGVLSQ